MKFIIVTNVCFRMDRGIKLIPKSLLVQHTTVKFFDN